MFWTWRSQTLEANISTECFYESTVVLLDFDSYGVKHVIIIVTDAFSGNC